MPSPKVEPRDVRFDVDPQPKGVDFLRALVSWRSGLCAHKATARGRAVTPEDVAWNDEEFKRWLAVLVQYRRLNPYVGKVARRFDPLHESTDPDGWLADDDETLERL